MKDTAPFEQPTLADQRGAATLDAARSLTELVEDEAAARGIAAWRIWASALHGIATDALPTVELDGRGGFLSGLREPIYVESIDMPISGGPTGITWRQVMANDLLYVRNNKQILGYFSYRYGHVMLAAATFRVYLNRDSTLIRSAGATPRGREPRQLHKVKNYLRETSPNDNIDRTPLKEIARQTNTSTSTVARALGRKK